MSDSFSFGASVDPLDLDIGLSFEEQTHLHNLRSSWGIIADLSFGDLILYIPSPDLPGDFVVAGQVRPSTSQTLYPQDLIGEVVSSKVIPLVAESMLTGRFMSGLRDLGELPEPVPSTAVPVRITSDKIIGIMSMISVEDAGRRPGQLEHTYQQLSRSLAEMVAEGSFPFDVEIQLIDDAPRVGDGVLVFDAEGNITFASPNAVSVLHKTGIHFTAVGLNIQEIGLGSGAFSGALKNHFPVMEECESKGDTYVLAQCIPILKSGQVQSGFMLLRDVTELRRRDRLLLNKDAAIREVHHRVKNNLQTISSLLRLQGRRLTDKGAKSALREAERRIRSIAVVHEILSRDSSTQVPFDEIIHTLVRITTESAVGDRKIKIRVLGDAGGIPSDIATPLAVAVAELLQNAVEHAFLGDDESASASGNIELQLSNAGGQLTLTVSDDGTGLDPEFDLDTTATLGLSLVRDLVRGQLNGDLKLSSNNGTVATISVPLTIQH